MATDEVFDTTYRDRFSKSPYALNLDPGYINFWSAGDAFREYFQNWMDGMLQTHHVHRHKIVIIISDSRDEWLAKASLRDSREMSGFIKFQKATGTLELTNFGAQLQVKDLRMGSSSKRSQDGLAGTHGEGFKIASLIMANKGYQVRYESTDRYWRFYFDGRDGGELYCQTSPMASTKLADAKIHYATRKQAGLPRETIANIWEDVCVKIGVVYNSSKTTGRAISFAKFQEWIQVSLALTGPPGKMIKGRHATLIMNESFQGKIYLKGLFLPKSSSSKQIKFAYDLNQGTINRERECLRDVYKEASLIAGVWAEAIQKQVPNAIKEYTLMLQEDDAKQFADVHMAKDLIGKNTAVAIWTYLKSLDEDSRLFYYHQRKADQDIQVICQQLKKIPKSLPTCLWTPLRRENLVKTPEEYGRSLLINAPASEISNTKYSNSVKRALKAVLSLDERTSALEPVFKSLAGFGLEVQLCDSQLVINDRWLEFESTHRQQPCWISDSGITIPDFLCDHVITYLYKQTLRQFKNNSVESSEEGDWKVLLQKRVTEGLRQMPRKVKVENGNSGEIVVSWTVLESTALYKQYGLDLKYKVILHRQSSCVSKRHDLLFSPGPEDFQLISTSSSEVSQNQAECGCPFQIAPQTEGGTTFSDLSHQEEYFAVVARMGAQAFIGVSDDTCRLSAEATNDHGTPMALTLRAASVLTPTHRQHNTEGFHRGGQRSLVCEDDYWDSDDIYASVDKRQTIEQENNFEIPRFNINPNEQRNVNSFTNTGDMTGEVEELEADSETPTIQEQRLPLARESWKSREQELDRITEALKTKDFELHELRRTSNGNEQRLENQVEALQAENQQLRDREQELETQCVQFEERVSKTIRELEQLRQAKNDIETQFSQTVSSLQSEVQELQQGKADDEVEQSRLLDAVKNLRDEVVQLQQTISTSEVQQTRSDAATSTSPALTENEAMVIPRNLSNAQEEIRNATSRAVELLAENLTLKDQNAALQSEVTQAQSVQNSMTSALQFAFKMIKDALNLESQTVMISTIQGVQGMLEVVLNLHKAAAPAKGIKRGKIDDLSDENGSGVDRASKRFRQG